jgi:hypothetical protein
MISADGLYRYGLGRQWNFERFDQYGDPLPLKCIMWVMLNPSTADADRDDPTIRKIIKFSKAWDFDALLVGNLFAFRTPFPEELRRRSHDTDVVGLENNQRLLEMASISYAVMLAWGTHVLARPRCFDVCNLLAPTPSVKLCLGTTKNGSPKHPLYVADSTKPMQVQGVNTK